MTHDSETPVEPVVERYEALLEVSDPQGEHSRLVNHDPKLF